MVEPQGRLRVLVLGYVVRRPLGGGVWPTLQYALGLLRLGHDVYFLEDSEDWGACYDPKRHVTDEDPTYGLEFAAKAFGRNELGNDGPTTTRTRRRGSGRARTASTTFARPRTC